MRLSVTLAIAALLAVAAAPARAWKPRTHVYLAEQALEDALDDGKITLYRVDPSTNRIQQSPNGGPVEIGSFAVRPDILEALRRAPAQFRAGVLGPDAFPDIVTGQTMIHPAGRVTPGETDVDLNLNGPGTNPWLEHLWRQVSNPDSRDATPANRAFVLGYLAHAAGDMFGHTLINDYTGGAFHFRPKPHNAVRHVVIESYIDQRVPDPTFQSSVGDGVADFIHRNLVQSTPGDALDRLQKGESAKLSLPTYFCGLREKLKRSLRGSSVPVAAYKRAWIKDIDAGLAAMPVFSHRLAVALFFNPSGKADVDGARRIVDDFNKRHLLSMAGLPDAVGASMRIFDSIVTALGLSQLLDLINELKKDAFSYLVRQATGLSPTELKRYLDDPASEFDPVNNREPEPGGRRVTRAEFDRSELALNSSRSRIDYRLVPAAFNTVTLIKLSFLDRAGVNQVMEALGSRERLEEENVLLGYIETLDGSRQWKANPRKMVFARSEADYAAVFMRQTGDRLP